jgi:hypothetical protein
MSPVHDPTVYFIETNISNETFITDRNTLDKFFMFYTWIYVVCLLS